MQEFSKLIEGMHKSARGFERMYEYQQLKIVYGVASFTLPHDEFEGYMRDANNVL